MIYADFVREYLADFSENKDYAKAYELRIKYNYECERFDQFACATRNERGEAIPRNEGERRLIGQHARNKMTEIQLEAKKFGISDQAWRNAKRKTERLTFEGLQREYERLFGEGKS